MRKFQIGASGALLADLLPTSLFFGQEIAHNINSI
jgi:hypothetical protein